jgi:hypothetical protein
MKFMNSLKTVLLGVAIAAATLSSVTPAFALDGCGLDFHRDASGQCVWGGQNQDWCMRVTGHPPVDVGGGVWRCVTDSPHANAQATSSGLPVPKGLSACAPSDPIAEVEAGIATKLGGTFLGCFKSEKTITMQGATKSVLVPFEAAFAFDLPGPFSSVDLDKLLATGIEQWKDFEPLSKDLGENYTVRLNELIKSAGISSAASVFSVKPVLVSIGRTGANSFSVVSIRRYVFDASGEQVIQMKVNGSADVLRGSRIVRLDIQRMLTDPSDVAQVQSEIAEWANAVSSAPTDQGAAK